MKFLLFALLVSSCAVASDLVLVDRATVMHDAVFHTRQVLRDTLVARYVNPRQEGPEGEIMYDTLYEVVEVWRRPQGPTRFNWNSITYVSWRMELWFGGSQQSEVFCMFGPKANQLGGNVDVLEAGRRMSPSDCWTIVTSSTYVLPGWNVWDRGAHVSGYFTWAFRTIVVDDFEYLAVHYQPAYSESPVSVRSPELEGCSLSMWSPEVSEGWLPAPEDPGVDVVMPHMDDGRMVYELPNSESQGQLLCYDRSGNSSPMPFSAVVPNRAGGCQLIAANVPAATESVVSGSRSWLLGPADVVGMPHRGVQ